MPYCILQAKDIKALRFHYVTFSWADLIKHSGNQTLKQQQQQHNTLPSMLLHCV